MVSEAHFREPLNAAPEVLLIQPFRDRIFHKFLEHFGVEAHLLLLELLNAAPGMPRQKYSLRVTLPHRTNFTATYIDEREYPARKPSPSQRRLS
jgi:hypothetical protein